MKWNKVCFWVAFLLITCVILSSTDLGSLHGSFMVAADDLQYDASWTSGGPYGGYVNELAMAGTDYDIIYAATDSGVFRSPDFGETWAEAGLNLAQVLSVAVDPGDADIVYAGTDDGLYESPDGGRNWTPLGLVGKKVVLVAVDHSNSEILYARADYAGDEVLYKSENGGGTWLPTLSREVTSFLIDPDDSSRLYAGVWGVAYGLYISDDGGDNWTLTPVSGVWNEDVMAMAMSSAGTDPPVIYASSWKIPTTKDVYRSTNRGQSWTPTGLGRVPYVLAVDPSDADVVYADVYKSANGGANWDLKDDGLPPTWATSIVIDPRDGDNLLMSQNEGHVHKSTNGADDWHFSSQGMNSANIRDVAVHPFESKVVLAAIEGRGHSLAGTDNGGDSWIYLIGGPANLGAVAIDPSNPALLYAGANAPYASTLYVYRSTDGGLNWWARPVVSGAGSGSLMSVSDIWVSPTDSSTLLAAVSWWGSSRGGVYKSTNTGVSWYRTYDFWANALASDPNNPQIVYFGSQDCGNVFRSINSGETWIKINPVVAAPQCWVDEVRDVAVDMDSRLYAATSEGLLRWQGSAWQSLTGLPTDDITAIAIDPSPGTSTLYVGTGENGVYVSSDGGDTWLPFNQGLSSQAISSLVVSPAFPRMIYAGMEYGGVWSRPIGEADFSYLPMIRVE